jgi:hypothetical protein
MEIKEIPLQYGMITLELRRGYTDSAITKEEVYAVLRELQEKLILEEQVYLSANCYGSEVVLSGQKENHLNIRFINYPRFPLERDTFRRKVTGIGETLLNWFEQNRLVIEFDDRLVMLQQKESIDPSIARQE